MKEFITFAKTFSMKASEQKVQTLIRDAISSIDQNAEIILFGSRARGDAGMDSDWDVLILVDQEKVSWNDEKIFRHKLYPIELRIAQPISIFVYSKKEWYGRLSVTPLFESIQAEGVTL